MIQSCPKRKTSNSEATEKRFQMQPLMINNERIYSFCSAIGRVVPVNCSFSFHVGMSRPDSRQGCKEVKHLRKTKFSLHCRQEHPRHHPPNLHIFFINHAISQVHKHKHLGVILSSTLSWSPMSLGGHLISRSSAMFGPLCHLHPYFHFSSRCLLKVYFCYIRACPLLEYGCSSFVCFVFSLPRCFCLQLEGSGINKKGWPRAHHCILRCLTQLGFEASKSHACVERAMKPREILFGCALSLLRYMADALIASLVPSTVHHNPTLSPTVCSGITPGETWFSRAPT